MKTQPDAILERTYSFLKKSSLDSFEIYLERRKNLKIDVKNQKADTVTHADDLGLAIRVEKQGKTGMTFTTAFDDSSISDSVARAIDIANISPVEPEKSLPRLSKTHFDDSRDQAGLKISVAQKLEHAKQLEAKCLETDPRVKAVRNATYAESESDFSLMDSQGNYIRETATSFSATVMCKSEQGSDAQMGYYYQAKRNFNELDFEFIAKKAGQSAVELLGATLPSSRKCPVLFRNDVVCDLVSFLWKSFSEEELLKGKSLLQGKWKEKVFSDKLTLVDDGNLAGGLATSLFDVEGTPTQCTSLISKGVFQDTLRDLQYGGKSGKPSTGNASRGFKSSPSISHSNLILSAGSTSHENLIRSMGNGILVTDLMALHTANPITGQFSLGASGFIVENGTVKSPVKGFAVAGNLLDMLSRVDDVGNDLVFFGSVGAPSLLVSELVIGGK